MTSPVAVRKENIRKWMQIGLICAAGFIIAPFVLMAIGGLVGAAVAATIGLAIVSFAPYVSMKFANWRVKAITAEAMENPIETMTNLLIEKRKAYEVFHGQVIQAHTAKKGFAQKCADFAKRYPARAPEFQAQLKNMEKLVEQKTQALQDAKAAIEAGEHKLEEMKAYWDMSQAAQAANKAAGMDTGDLFEKLKADTAVQSVYDSMNRAFAELEVASALNDTPSLDGIEYQPQATLPTTINVKAKELA